MTLKVVPPRYRQPPKRCILFGPVGSWKSSVYATIPKLLWLDLHGSTSTLPMQPACAWEPAEDGARPANYDAFRAALRDIKKLRADYDGIVVEGLDDIERLYLIPEALSRTNKKTLSDDFWSPARMLLQLHREILQEFETLWYAGFAIYFTCHDQVLERINPDGFNFQVTDLNLFYLAGKTGNINCPEVWRLWVDFNIFLTSEGRIAKKGEKDKIAKAVGDPTKHVAYLRGEAWLDCLKARHLEDLKSPFVIQSPQDLWAALSQEWDRKFCVDIDKLKAEAKLRVQAFIDAGKTQNPDKAWAMLEAAQDVPSLHQLINKLR